MFIESTDFNKRKLDALKQDQFSMFKMVDSEKSKDSFVQLDSKSMKAEDEKMATENSYYDSE